MLQVFIDALCNTFKKSVTAVLRSVTFSVYAPLQSVTTFLLFLFNIIFTILTI